MKLRCGLLLVMVVAAAGLAGGCADSAYRKLTSERQVADLRLALEERERLGNHTVLTPTRGPEGPWARVAVHEIGAGDSERVLVFVHGMMSDHGAWRFMVGELAREYDLWLIDLPGCGDSDKPDPARMGSDGYSPAALGHRIMEAIEARLAARAAPAKVGIVAHSLGGAAVLRMLGDDSIRERFAETAERVDRLVLISPLDVTALNHKDPRIAELATVGPLEVRVGSMMHTIQDRISEATYGAVVDPSRALREEADTRIGYVTDVRKRRAMQAMLKQAVAWKGDRPDWDANEAVRAMYPNIGARCMIVWGMRDEILPCSMGYKLAAELPDAEMVCLENTMHSPHLERPGDIARLLKGFMETGAAPDHRGQSGHAATMAHDRTGS